MSINFNIPAKAQRKTDPLQPYTTTTNKKHNLPANSTSNDKNQTNQMQIDTTIIDK